MTTRLLDNLPAIYRGSASLRDVLAAFEELLFTGHHDAKAELAGIESRLRAVPSLFAPLGLDGGDASSLRTPAHFLPWIASWLAFTPHALFEPEQLRRIVAGLVPLYGRRGTRAYLKQLLELCFEDVAQVRVDERDLTGLCLGRSRIGVDTLLAEQRPFWFSVDVRVHSTARVEQLEPRLRAVIDFAKPAHTVYDLRLHLPNPDEDVHG
jgi:phage tail-like protein